MYQALSYLHVLIHYMLLPFIMEINIPVLQMKELRN